jgi:hypothetical protein
MCGDYGTYPTTLKLLEDLFDERTTPTYEVTTSLPKPKRTHEQNARYAETNIAKFKETSENFNVGSFFRRTLSLEEGGPANFEQDKAVGCTFYFAEVRDMNASK